MENLNIISLNLFTTVLRHFRTSRRSLATALRHFCILRLSLVTALRQFYDTSARYSSPQQRLFLPFLRRCLELLAIRKSNRI